MNVLATTLLNEVKSSRLSLAFISGLLDAARKLRFRVCLDGWHETRLTKDSFGLAATDWNAKSYIVVTRDRDSVYDRNGSIDAGVLNTAIENAHKLVKMAGFTCSDEFIPMRDEFLHGPVFHMMVEGHHLVLKGSGLMFSDTSFSTEKEKTEEVRRRKEAKAARQQRAVDVLLDAGFSIKEIKSLNLAFHLRDLH